MKVPHYLAVIIALAALSAGAQLHGAAVTFATPGEGGSNWNVPDSWNPGTVPDATTDVNISNGFCYIQLGDDNLACNRITIGSGGKKCGLIFNAPSKLTVTSGTIANGGGVEDSLITIQSDPVVINATSINTDAFVVGQGKVSGTYTIPAGQSWTALWVFLGNGGAGNDVVGALTINGGSLSTNNLWLSNGAGTMGLFTLTSGTLAGQNICRKQGTATFTWNDGTIQTLPDQHMTFFGAEADKPLNIQLAGKGTHTLAPGNEKTITVQETAVFVDMPGQQGTLTINGPGTVNILSTTNTYSGITRVQAGTLTTGTTGALGKGDVEVGSGATLTLGNNASLARTSNVKVGGKNCYINLNYTGSPVAIASLSLNGTLVRPGTYTAAQLNALAKGQWFGTGSLTVTAFAKPSAPTR